MYTEGFRDIPNRYCPIVRITETLSISICNFLSECTGTAVVPSTEHNVTSSFNLCVTKLLFDGAIKLLVITPTSYVRSEKTAAEMIQGDFCLQG